MDMVAKANEPSAWNTDGSSISSTHCLRVTLKQNGGDSEAEARSVYRKLSCVVLPFVRGFVKKIRMHNWNVTLFLDTHYITRGLRPKIEAAGTTAHTQKKGGYSQYAGSTNWYRGIQSYFLELSGARCSVSSNWLSSASIQSKCWTVGKVIWIQRNSQNFNFTGRDLHGKRPDGNIQLAWWSSYRERKRSMVSSVRRIVWGRKSRWRCPATIEVVKECCNFCSSYKLGVVEQDDRFRSRWK